ncbi:MAG TPA: response regulator [Pirellulaceae bacterium]|nr:response regulator [Pirellulaceae bacterium]
MSKRLLVADDALIIREIIKDRAIQAGWEIVGEATNGKEAVEQYCACRPDVMTLDLVMPEYDGLYALQGIIQIAPDAKVVVVSALDQKEVLKRAFQLGAADFVVKPFDQGLLIETLERMLA